MNNKGAAKGKDAGKQKGGRKEVLTEELAKKIGTMISRMPDAGVPATWKNIEIHVEKKFQIPLKRNAMSTKEWGGKKLIWEAWDQAVKDEKRLKGDTTSKYANTSRAGLRKHIASLEAKVLTLQTQLDATREHQYDELCVLWQRNTPLHKLLDEQGKTK